MVPTSLRSGVAPTYISGGIVPKFLADQVVDALVLVHRVAGQYIV